MPVPKRKVSRARRDKAFANKKIKVKVITQCGNCSEPLSPHQVCHYCGFYKGEKILTTKLDRAIARGRNKETQEEKVLEQKSE